MSIALVGAARPPAKPAATPAPSPTPTAAPTTAQPILVVYPFSVTGDIKPDTGTKAAALFVQQITQAGDIAALQGNPSVQRSNYPTDAVQKHADYYLSGYMTLIGDGVSLVEQLVSVSSGTIVYSNTAQIQSFNDAASQAHAIHDALIANEKRFTAAINNQPAASSTPSSMPGNQANIGGLFKHGNRDKATPAPKLASADKPQKGIFIVRIGGALPDGELTAGTQSLYQALGEHYNAKMTGATGNASKSADSICGTDRNNTVATGDVATGSVKSGFFRKAQYTFTLSVYTCFGAQLAQTSGTGSTLGDAIRAAVDAYATNHPANS
ncbi:MAG: hypothetical protein ACXWNK_03850 [Vulcanimicrobiaceae bacterium]